MVDHFPEKQAQLAGATSAEIYELILCLKILDFSKISRRFTEFEDNGQDPSRELTKGDSESWAKPKVCKIP